MGFGIISLLKQIAPFSVYLLFIGLSIMAITGRPRWALLLTTALLPLRNVADKLDQYPLGKDVIDILMICMILGWVFSSLTQRHRFFERSPFNGVIVALVLYSYLSFLNGYSYLDYFTPFDFSDSRLQYLKNFCLLPILYFITLNTIKDKKWIRRVIMVICATMILMNYYMVSQLSWFASVESRAKMHGTFVFLGPNEVAAFYNQYTLIILGIYFLISQYFFGVIGIIIASEGTLFELAFPGRNCFPHFQTCEPSQILHVFPQIFGVSVHQLRTLFERSVLP